MTRRSRAALVTSCLLPLAALGPSAPVLAQALSPQQRALELNDETTRHFMVAFHRALATSGRAAALQQAQFAILRTQATAHPFYWAPFILIGGR